VGDKTVQQDTAGKRFECTGDYFEKSGFAAGVGTEDGDDLTGAAWKLLASRVKSGAWEGLAE